MKRTGSRRTGTGFGTFGGVFTPCTLTILGVILFLRLGQVTGQAVSVSMYVVGFTEEESSRHRFEPPGSRDLGAMDGSFVEARGDGLV